MQKCKVIVIIMLIALFGYATLGFSDTNDISKMSEDKAIETIQAEIEAKGANWIAGKTSVSNLSAEEKELLNNSVLPLPISADIRVIIKPDDVKEAKGTFDWRDKDGHNWMTPVKHQHSCGSCWAFAAVGVIEAMINIESGNPIKDVDLSEQHLVSDCCNIISGDSYPSCIGGYPSIAYQFIKSSGIALESRFPYMARNSACIPCPDWQDDAWKITSYSLVNGSIEDFKYAIETYGPISTIITVPNDWYYYKGGVYESVSNYDKGNHAVVLVGWDDTEGCWLVKNSWGSDWGFDGYAKIKYGIIERDYCAMIVTGTSGGSTKYPLKNEGLITSPSGPYNWNYELGYMFKPLVDGKITELGFWGTGDGDTKVCNLWANNGTKIASVNVTDSRAGFSYASINPIAVTAGTYYKVSVSAPTDLYLKNYSTPNTIGDIYIYRSCYAPGSGNYPYVSNTNNMYGIADIGFVRGEYPWANNENGTLRTNINWYYTMGYHFTPEVDGTIKKLGGYFNGTRSVKLWNKSTGELLASVDVTSSNEWSYVDIIPVAVTAGNTYTVAAYIGDSGASYRYQVSNFPKTYGNITINSSTCKYGDQRPTNTLLSNMYGQVDICFVFSGGGAATIENENNIPNNFSLSQNYPNPFNPETTIGYALPKSSAISLKIYNLAGQLVKTLVDGNQEAGYNSVVWDGTNDNGKSVASGIYIYSLINNESVITKKMLMIK